jgi:hypothetical protein
MWMIRLVLAAIRPVTPSGVTQGCFARPARVSRQ